MQSSGLFYRLIDKLKFLVNSNTTKPFAKISHPQRCKLMRKVLKYVILIFKLINISPHQPKPTNTTLSSLKVYLPFLYTKDKETLFTNVVDFKKSPTFECEILGNPEELVFFFFASHTNLR